jgi:glutaredoxin 3
MVDVRIYTTPFCGYCMLARQLLGRKGVRYTEIDVSNDQATRRMLVETTGQRTVPQVFIAGTPYGGYTDIAALDRAGHLDGLLGVGAA